ncbi:MAG: hypothetical protein JWP81_16 [Ferruginibacter sp.]|nr:hypothetical protein [Ferruginibacter sp.]
MVVTDSAGTIIDVVEGQDAGDGIEVFQGMLTPGFVNAHCHLELSHLKGMIPANTGLVSFVQQVMSNRACSAEQKQEAMMTADAAMYAAGIVAVGDICNTADSITVKNQSKIHWHNFVEVSGFVDAKAQQRLDEMKKVYDQFQVANPGKGNTTFSPHAPYSVSKTLFQLLNDATAGQLITIHNQECAAENHLYQQKTGDFLSLYKNFGIDISVFEPTGKTSFQSWLPMFSGAQSILAVHNTFIDIEDLTFFKNLSKPVEVYYCICINANKHIEQITPPLELMMKHNCNMVIGTDSLASNYQLDILEEIKAIQQETNLPLTELLQWATLNGARALQMEDKIGSFEKGKKPGIVLIEELTGLQAGPQSFSRRIL